MNTNVVQQNTGGYGMFSPQQLIDYTFTNYIMGSMSKLAEKEFSMSIVFTVILLLSLQELKGILIDILKTTSEYIKNNYKNFFKDTLDWIKTYVIPYISPIYYFFWKKQENKIMESEVACVTADKIYYSTQYKIKYSMPFMQNLVKYMGDNPMNCSYIVDDNKKIEIKNFEEINVTEIWKKILIKYDDIDINIVDNLSLTFIKKQNRSFLIGSEKINIVDFSSIFTFSDLMFDTPLKNYIKKFVVVAGIDKIKPDYNNVKGTYVCHLEPKYLRDPVIFFENINTQNVQKYFELYVILLLKTCCPNLNIITSYFEFILLRKKMDRILNGFYTAIHKHINTTGSINFFNNIIKFDKNDIKNLPDPNNSILLYDGLITNNINAQYDQTDLDVYNIWFSELSKNKIIPPITESGTELNINVTSLNNTISNQFSNFISIINSNTRENKDVKNKIKIFNVNINRENIIEEIDNPLYIEYMDKYNMISNMGKENGTNKGNEETKEINPKSDLEKSPNNHVMDVMMRDYFSGSIPAKKIKNESIKKSVSCDYINDKSKSFDTLYLREKDIRRLKFAIENFHEKTELLESLGLPNKLGILLHGEPGTGKTSTIWAIATYLNKDIYYVNLNTIETNDELQMVFDYVNKNCINGGIITFEDIDAMTDVIHKRSVDLEVKDNSENIVSLMQNKKSKLTLEYFLNILQGTLTQDGTTFIVTTNHLNKLDPAFYRDGRFDVKIKMEKCDRYQIQKIYEKFIKRKLKDDLLNKIPEDVYTPANIIFHLKDYILDEYPDEKIIDSLLENNN